MKSIPPLPVALALSLLTQAGAAPGANQTSLRVVSTSEAAWTHLNPARGDKAPSAATLWGDRGGTVATGFLLRPRDGFQSPPHIHNVSYRALTIRGELHNADPRSPEEWMPTGSFWTQPRGDVHITSARGDDVLAYVEIDAGPYLVRPPEEAVDTGEVPLNVHVSNLVWVDPSAPGANRDEAPQAPSPRARLAYLWGDPQADQPSGVLVRLPSGAATEVLSQGPLRRAVVIEGRPRVWAPGQVQVTGTEPGTYVEIQGPGHLRASCPEPEDCLLYLRANGGYGLRPLRGSSGPGQSR